MTERVTLRAGDYVSTAGMTEDQYHAVARAFMTAGARRGEYVAYPRKVCPAFGWRADSGELYYGQKKGNADNGTSEEWAGQPGGRHLTISQVLNATNAGNKEEDMTPCEKLGYRVGDRFITNGSGAFTDGSEVVLFRDDGTDCPLFRLLSGYTRYSLADGEMGAHADLKFVTPHAPEDTLTQTLRDAADHDEKAKHHAAEHDRLMQQAREMLPDGWRLVRDGEPEEDLTAPANWKQGDQLECVKSWAFGTKGKIYKVGNFNRVGYRRKDEGVLAIPVSDDDGDNASVAHHYFRFHHRPT